MIFRSVLFCSYGDRVNLSFEKEKVCMYIYIYIYTYIYIYILQGVKRTISSTIQCSKKVSYFVEVYSVTIRKKRTEQNSTEQASNVFQCFQFTDL